MFQKSFVASLFVALSSPLVLAQQEDRLLGYLKKQNLKTVCKLYMSNKVGFFIVVLNKYFIALKVDISQRTNQ
jgi:hypothetical protein